MALRTEGHPRRQSGGGDGRRVLHNTTEDLVAVSKIQWHKRKEIATFFHNISIIGNADITKVQNLVTVLLENLEQSR